MAAVMEAIDAPLAVAGSGITTLHSRFRRPLQRYFASYRLGTDEAEDLTQEVFLRLMGEGCPPTLRSPEAYVFTLARNLVRDRARRLYIKAGHATVPLDDVQLRCDGPTPDEVLEHGERLRQVVACLRSLKPDARRAFVLHRIHGHSYAEIARTLGVSVSMIEKHVMAAIAALRNG
jgi:RNA polymerase sigma factor (sigma-70 family)